MGVLRLDLTSATTLLPTPTASTGGPDATTERPSGAKGTTNLAGSLLPTPLARDYKGGRTAESPEQFRLPHGQGGTPGLPSLAQWMGTDEAAWDGDPTEEPFADGRLF